jgi:hypothetical protein
LSLGDLPDTPLTGFGEADDRRRGARALRVWDDDWFAVLYDRDAAVGRA